MIAFTDQPPDPTPAQLFEALAAMQQQLSSMTDILREITTTLHSFDLRLTEIEQGF